ncbi:MAG: hypothetical protein IH594_15260 [Bacteroidales bacterium]|nr:hypothetical protein [Bacteroidales bacterium]
MNSLCILIPILIGLICALLGYLLGRLVEKKSEKYVKLRADLEACKKENEKQLSLNASLQNDVENWKSKFSSLQSDFEAYKLNPDKSGFAGIPFDAAMAASVLGKTIKENDLKIIEGIGPAIEKLFHNAGIKTWKELAETTVEKCQQILDDAGEKFKMHKPSTWPVQSEMAWLGKWNELKEWQDKMSGGIE